MASLSPGLFPPPQSGGGPVAPHHFRSPTPRELRAQAAHRLQIGALGLGSMLLLVGLANIIMDRARVNERAGAVAALPTATPAADAAKTGGDPLADIGVVPDLPSGKGAPSAGPSAAAGGSSVTR